VSLLKRGGLIVSEETKHSMSIKQSLVKQQNDGIIFFIEVQATRTRKHKQFLVRDRETQNLTEIFFDNKYRQDTVNTDNFFITVKQKAAELKKGVEDIGIYSTKQEYKEMQKIVDFIIVSNK